MASTIIFVVMTIIAGLLLLIASITSTMAAANIMKSNSYASNQKAKNAYQYLVIAAVLGWSSLVTLIVILIVAVIAGGFTTTQLSTEFINNPNPNKVDLVEGFKVKKSLESGGTTQIIIIIIFIALAILTLIIGILSVMSAVQIGGIPNRDSFASSAYTETIITAIATIAGIAMLIIAIIAFFGIRAAKQQQYKEAETFVALTEQKLGVQRTELEAAVVTLS